MIIRMKTAAELEEAKKQKVYCDLTGGCPREQTDWDLFNEILWRAVLITTMRLRADKDTNQEKE